MLATSAALAAIIATTTIVKAAPAPVGITAPTAGTLTIDFTGVATPTGAILLSVYDSENAFDGDGEPIREAMIPATSTIIETTLKGLPAGQYAIKAFHDIDGDMKMSANPFGMPTEPFAFSNNAIGNRGPAKWADATFTIGVGENRHSITIR